MAYKKVVFDPESALNTIEVSTILDVRNKQSRANQCSAL
jgi:hypothetical protein